MDMANKKVRALRSIDHMRVFKAKNGPTYPTLNFPHYNTLYYSIRSFTQLQRSSDVPVLQISSDRSSDRNVFPSAAENMVM